MINFQTEYWIIWGRGSHLENFPVGMCGNWEPVIFFKFIFMVVIKEKWLEKMDAEFSSLPSSLV